MKKMMWAIVLCAMLCGCGSTPATQNQPKWVTRISAEYQKGVIRLHRDYTDDDKIRPVLNYFRALSPYGSLESVPEGESNVEVTVYFSDGSRKVYEQRSNSYLRQDGGIWQNIDPEKGQELGLLLGLSESDENF